MTNMERAAVWMLGIVGALAAYMIILIILFHVSPKKMAKPCSITWTSPDYTPAERAACGKK